nr:MAG TPA: ADP-ribosyltransferase exoenzyme [Caudoviricetes sp.]
MGGRGSSGGKGGKSASSAPTEYKNITRSMAEKLQEQVYGQDSYWIVKNATEDYVAGVASYLNYNLRVGDPLSPTHKDVMSKMDGAMKPLGADIKLTRFIDKSYAVDILGLQQSDFTNLKGAADKLNKTVVGNVIRETAYMSTSYNPKANVFTYRTVKMNIKAPKNTKGIITNNRTESEIVLGRNTKYTITGAKANRGKLELDVTILP